MTPAELRELVEQATPGPWRIFPRQAAVYTTDGKASIASMWNVPLKGAMYRANRSLIALAPDLALLCAEYAGYVEACCDEHNCSESGFALDDSAGPCAAHRALAKLSELKT